MSQELEYTITSKSCTAWKENLEIGSSSFFLREEDRLLPVMQMGEIPVKTCMSYEDGVYNNCLLACHDANKKVLYLTYNGKTVLRAAIRLTKGAYTDMREFNSKRKLEFADLYDHNENGSERVQHKESIVLFLERPYYAGLPKEKEIQAIELILQLMKKKAKQLGALLILSRDYQDWNPKDFVKNDFFMYISKSKAGAQYLDSLRGSRYVSEEGSYEKHRFLIWISH